MKLTNIRKMVEEDIDLVARKLTAYELKEVASSIVELMQLQGFIVNAEVVNSSSIKLGYNKKQFVVDTNKHGYNRYVHNGKRTSLPTWQQRVTFNNKLNMLLDKVNLSANIQSGPFTIRKGMKRYNASDWHVQTPDWMRQNWRNGYTVE